VHGDSLSQDTNLSDRDLTILFASSIPKQAPLDFNICPLPPALCCKLETWLRKIASANAVTIATTLKQAAHWQN
jgi:hypothetical protein